MADESARDADVKEFVKEVSAPMFKVRETNPNYGDCPEDLMRVKDKRSKSDLNRLSDRDHEVDDHKHVYRVQEVRGCPPLAVKEDVSPDDEDPDAHKTAEDLSMDIDTALAEVMSGIKALGLSHSLDLDSSSDDAVKPVRRKTYELKVDTQTSEDQKATQPTGRVSGLLVTKQKDVVNKPRTPEVSKKDKSRSDAEFKHTPDLVIDLPSRTAIQPPSPPRNATTDSPSTDGGRQLTTAEVFAKPINVP